MLSALAAIASGAAATLVLSGHPLPGGKLHTPLMGAAFGLGLAVLLSAAPLVVKWAIQLRASHGDPDRESMKSLLEHEAVIVWGIWGAVLLALVIAVSASAFDGLFRS